MHCSVEESESCPVTFYTLQWKREQRLLLFGELRSETEDTAKTVSSLINYIQLTILLQSCFR